jgi:hypothetical protein
MSDVKTLPEAPQKSLPLLPMRIDSNSNSGLARRACRDGQYRDGQYCDGLSRRQALKIGGTGLMGGLTLPQLLAADEQTAESTRTQAKAKACILIFLEGGPSHIDLWDLKPDAPKEIRGPYNPIPTNVPGTFIGELLPRCAKVADKYTIVRSHSHGDNGHQTGYHRVLTGYPAAFGDGQAPGLPTNALYPSIGSIVARELGPGGAVPPYVNMPNPLPPGGPGFYGPAYSPFVIETDPAQPDFEVRDVNLNASGIDPARFEFRRRLLERVEELGSQGQLPAALSGAGGAMAKYYEKALSLITSRTAKEAFDIQAEPQKLRERYGYTSLGQCSLLARRLVESGCRFVGIDHGSWDTHFDNFTSLEKALAPSLDMALSALVTDLSDRGMLDETLIVVMGEMGRTPRINADAGRDHWSGAQTVIFAGGGTIPGAVVGATDKHAAEVTSTPVSIQDVLRTVFTLMGIDSDKIYNTPLGRPVPIVNAGRVIHEILA